MERFTLVLGTVKPEIKPFLECVILRTINQYLWLWTLYQYEPILKYKLLFCLIWIPCLDNVEAIVHLIFSLCYYFSVSFGSWEMIYHCMIIMLLWLFLMSYFAKIVLKFSRQIFYVHFTPFLSWNLHVMI